MGSYKNRCLKLFSRTCGQGRAPEGDLGLPRVPKHPKMVATWCHFGPKLVPKWSPWPPKTLTIAREVLQKSMFEALFWVPELCSRAGTQNGRELLEPGPVESKND